MDKVYEILQEVRPDIDFKTQTALIDDGILDSFDIIAIVSELNSQFDIEINVTDLVPENFNSAEAIAKLVERLKK